MRQNSANIGRSPMQHMRHLFVAALLTLPFQLAYADGRAEILRKFYDVASDPPMTTERIAQWFSWNPGAVQSVNKQGWNLKFQVNGNEQVLTAGLSGDQNSTELVMSLAPRPCITSEDVFAVFGEKFRPLVAIRHPHPINLPVAIEKNMSKFFDGPIYSLDNDGLRTTVQMEFGLSECLSRVRIREPKHYGANE